MGMIDIGIIVIVFLSSIIGIFRGFVREVLSLVSWVASFYIAFRFHGELLQYLTFISPESFRKGAAFLGLFFLVLIVFTLLNYVIAKLVDSTGLSGTDRTLGLVFGVARGVAIILVLVILSGLTPLPESKLWSKSMLIPHFLEAGKWLKESLPENFSKYLDVDVITNDTSENAQLGQPINPENITVEGQ